MTPRQDAPASEDWHHRCDIPTCNCGRCHHCGESIPEDAPASDGPATEALRVRIHAWREANDGCEHFDKGYGPYRQCDDPDEGIPQRAILAIEAEAAAGPRSKGLDVWATLRDAIDMAHKRDELTIEGAVTLLSMVDLLEIEAEAAAGPRSEGLDDRLVRHLTRWLQQSGWVRDYEHARAEAEGFVSHYAAAGPRSEGLDVERLARSFDADWPDSFSPQGYGDPRWKRALAEVIAREYGALSAASSSESEP